MVLIARELSSLLLLEFGVHPFTSVAVKEIFLSERVTLDNPSLSEHDIRAKDTTENDANRKLTLRLLMYSIALSYYVCRLPKADDY